MKQLVLKGKVLICIMMFTIVCLINVYADTSTVTETFNDWTGEFYNEIYTTEGLNNTDFTYTPKQFKGDYVYGKSVKVTEGNNALFLGARFPTREDGDTVPTQVKPFTVMEPIKKQNVGENGTAILESDFKIDKFFEHSGKVDGYNYKSQPFSLSGELCTTEFDFDSVKDQIADFAEVNTADGGKWLGYTDSNGANQNYNSYFEIQSADKISIFAKVYTLNKALTEGEWHHFALLINGDNTYSLNIDEETVVHNEPIEAKYFRIRYTYKDATGTIKNYDSAEGGTTSFRGFKSLWLQYYEDPYYTDGEQGYHIDNISISSSASGLKLPNYVYFEPFDGYTGGSGETQWKNNADKNNVSMWLAGSDNYPVISTESLGGKTEGYLRINYTESKKRAHTAITRKDVYGWESGKNGATKFTLDFLLTNENSPAFVGGYLLYYDESKTAQQAKYVSGQNTAPFIKVSANTAEAMGVAAKELETSLALNTWHTITLYLNGDNTFSMFINDEMVYGDENFSLISNDSNYTAKDVEIENFLGFSQIWLQRGSVDDPADATGAVCYDDLSLTLYDEYYKLGILKESTAYYEPFDGWNGQTGNAVWKSNADKNNVNIYLDGTNNYPSLSAEGIGGKIADYFAITYSDDKERAYAAISRNDVKGWENNKDGATKLSVDFALSDLNSSAFIGGYILHYDENGEAMQLKYRDSSKATGAFIRIDGTTVSAWDNTATLQTPLETNKWYTATLYMNGDFTYSLYIDDMPIFLNKSIYFDTFGDFYDKATDSTVTPENFLGFTQIWLQRGSKLDTANSSVYYDNVKLVTANQYYVADTSVQDAMWAQEAANSLKIYTTHIENGLALDTVVAMNGAENYATVTWKSSNPEIISDYGDVYPKVGEEQKVTLTATITYQEQSVTKTFEITVPAVDDYKIIGVKITGEDGIEDTSLVGGKTVSKVSVKRYTASNDKFSIVTALYKDGVMKDLTVNEVTPELLQYSDGDIELQNAIALPNDINGYTLKVCIWNNMADLKALAESLIVEQQKSEVTIFTAGDSTVQTYNASAKPQEGWGQNLAEFFTDAVSVDNSQSMGGRSTKSFVAEKRLNTIIDRIKPGDYLLVSFGHNDAKTDTQRSSLDGSYISRGTSIDEYNSYARYLEIYVDAARDKGANVILVTSVNRVKDRTGENLEGYPEAMEAFAVKKNVPVLDLTQKSIELQKKLDTAGIAPENLYMYWRSGDTRFDFTGSNYSNENSYADGTHFNSYGAKCIAQLVAEELEVIGSPLSRFADGTKFFDVIENMPEPLYTK